MTSPHHTFTHPTRPGVARSGQTPYDFRQPDRITKETLRPLQFLFDRFAHNLGTSLSAYLRVSTDVHVWAVQQMAYREFVEALPDQTVYYALSLDPVQGVGGLEVSAQAAFAMIDRMLGGRGTSAPVARGLTDIEQRVVDNVVRLMLEHMTTEWRNVGAAEFRVQRQEARPRMLHIAAPHEPVVALTLVVKLGESVGTVKFCLPAALLKEMDPGFAGHWRARGTDADRQVLHRNLASVPLDAEVSLEIPLLAAELLQLAVGDVVSLGTPVETPLEVRICGKRKFTGRLAQTASTSSLTVGAVVGQTPA